MRHINPWIGLVAGLALVGCSSAPEPGPIFDDEGARPITCLTHQQEEPGDRYADPALRNTAEVLALMRYYTAHGTKPYCDGAPPSETDRAWAQTYRGFGGAPDKIAGKLP